MRYNVQRGYRPEPWNAPRAARKPEASLRAVQARAGYAGGRPRAAPRCCSLATLESVCLPPRTSAFSKPCEAWLQAIADAAAAIFAEAKTETEVCELEQAIYEEINQVAATRIAELS